MAYVLCVRRMLKSYTNNVKLLELQIDILNNSVDREEIYGNNNNADNELNNESPAQIKLKMYKLFQKGIIIFIALKILFYWTSSLLLYEYPWINDIILNFQL